MVSAERNSAGKEKKESGLSAQKGFIVLNPVAGEGNPDQIKAVLHSSLDEENYDLYETTGEESLSDVVHAAVSENAYGWVAAIGGDGTVSRVANGLVDSGIPLAIIPAGTGNALAKALAIPQDTEGACELLQDAQHIRHVDGLQVGDQTFFLHMGVGIESKTMERTSAEQKNRFGSLAYLWTAVKEAAGWQPHHFAVTVDGETHHLDASELVLANASEIGVLGLEWAESIIPDDSRVDLVVVRARSLLDYVQLLWALVRRRQRSQDHVQFFQAQQEIKLEAKRPLPVHGDGELIGSKQSLTAAVRPGVLQIIAPAS